jgi:hypothetical protein
MDETAGQRGLLVNVLGPPRTGLGPGFRLAKVDGCKRPCGLLVSAVDRGIDRKSLPALSGGCNELAELLGWCHPAERFARPFVELGGDGVEPGVGDGGEVDAEPTSRYWRSSPLVFSFSGGGPCHRDPVLRLARAVALEPAAVAVDLPRHRRGRPLQLRGDVREAASCDHAERDLLTLLDRRSCSWHLPTSDPRTTLWPSSKPWHRDHYVSAWAEPGWVEPDDWAAAAWSAGSVLRDTVEIHEPSGSVGRRQG